MDLTLYCYILILSCIFLHGTGEPGISSYSSLPHFNQTLTNNNERQNSNINERYDNITIDVGATKVITVGSNRLTKLSLANNSKICNFEDKKNNIAFWIFEVHTDTLKVSLTLTPEINNSKDALEVNGKTM